MKKKVVKIPECLTPRQGEVFLCILKGMNNQEISDSLQISYNTAKLMANTVLKKLKQPSKNHLMAQYITS